VTVPTAEHPFVPRHRWWLRAAMWTLAPFVDSWEGLSLNRFLSVFFAVVGSHGRLVHDVPLTAIDLSVLILSGALAFSKDVFIDFLNRRKDETPA
jgi:hypothetical protein